MKMVKVDGKAGTIEVIQFQLNNRCDEEFYDKDKGVAYILMEDERDVRYAIENFFEHRGVPINPENIQVFRDGSVFISKPWTRLEELA